MLSALMQNGILLSRIRPTTLVSTTNEKYIFNYNRGSKTYGEAPNLDGANKTRAPLRNH